MLEYYQKELNIDVVEVSATTGYGIDKLRTVLKDKMAVLVGNS
jgi:putative ribosome biogenesis GTPase RsgA